jgi:CHASE3 domain sensor protein
MALAIRRSFKILAPGGSLRRRVAYSLAIVRLILVPVIFLAVYYLFAMGWIVDRIVNVDAPATTMSEQVSVEMLEARRAERNYLLLRDPAYVEANRAAIAKTREMLIEIENLVPSDQSDAQKALDELHLYQQRFDRAVSILGAPGQAPPDRIQAVVRAYEKDLNELFTQARFRKRAQLVDELRSRVDSFDIQISKTVQEQDPELRQATVDLENSSQEILRRTSELESRSWKRVQEDHRQARHLINQAEWALSVVSALTFLLSVWISFILPRQVVKPLLNLKHAVDRAATGDSAIDFDIQGKGEVVELANSVQNLSSACTRRNDLVKRLLSNAPATRVPYILLKCAPLTFICSQSVRSLDVVSRPALLVACTIPAPESLTCMRSPTL